MSHTSPRKGFAGILVWLNLLIPMPDSQAHADELQDAIKKDRKAIAGTWQVIELEIDGNPAKSEDAKRLLVVNGDDGTRTLTVDGKEVSKGTSTIDPTKSPKQLDFTPSTGDTRGALFLGIYELGEKSRKMCFSPQGKPRPKEFVSKSGTGDILVKFERVK
ncbi:MAG: TIGR03067 domain-containing protein [Planctomycetes bacterium]|nr:TIGR03067 domain-containing protein [Planctomycetota bacterium]